MGAKPSNMAGPVVCSATSRHTASVIFLHGLGDTGHGWASTLSDIKAPHVKLICPTAPSIPVTLNSRFVMPSWFDLISLDITGPEDVDGIKKAALNVHKMIDNEIEAGIPSNRIVLGGFSQGGALAIYSALKYKKPLGGIIGLSCWLPLHQSFPADILGNSETPLLQCHGDCDPVVKFEYGQMTAKWLKDFMRKAQFKNISGMSHSSSEEEMEIVKNFLNTCIPAE